MLLAVHVCGEPQATAKQQGGVYHAAAVAGDSEIHGGGAEDE